MCNQAVDKTARWIAICTLVATIVGLVPLYFQVFYREPEDITILVSPLGADFDPAESLLITHEDREAESTQVIWSTPLQVKMVNNSSRPCHVESVLIQCSSLRPEYFEFAGLHGWESKELKQAILHYSQLSFPIEILSHANIEFFAYISLFLKGNLVECVSASSDADLGKRISVSNDTLIDCLDDLLSSLSDQDTKNGLSKSNIVDKELRITIEVITARGKTHYADFMWLPGSIRPTT